MKAAPKSSNPLLQLDLRWPKLRATVRKQLRYKILAGQCAGAKLCPLSRIEAGAVVCIKKLFTAPDITDRLRELGLREEQQIKLVARESNFICQVCNARLGISEELAESIFVEAVPATA